MNSFSKRRWRLSVSMSYLLGFVLTMGSASVISGCGDDSSQTKMSTQKDEPAVIAKDSMDAYKNSHLKGGATKKN
jgi:hypothetical protein